jgi:hypothetical protein
MIDVSFGHRQLPTIRFGYFFDFCQKKRKEFRLTDKEIVQYR